MLTSRVISFYAFVAVLIVVCCIRHTATEIPLKLAKRLSKVSSTEEFLRRFVHKDPQLSTTSKSVRGQKSAALKKSLDPSAEVAPAPSIATPQNCQPRDTVVPIPEDANPLVFYWPTCVSVPRCGGCCTNNALICEPTSVTNVTVQIIKTIFDESTGSFRQDSVIEVPLISHTECDCQCRVKVADCDVTLHRYDADSCQCVCLNEISCTSPKQWDLASCSCVCPVILNCLDDEYFNYRTCTCRNFDESASEVTGTEMRAQSSTAAASSACPGLHCLPGYEPVKLPGQCYCVRRSLTTKRTARLAVETRDLEADPQRTSQ